MSSIIEVANRAGVSTATVSRVFSTPDLVTPETRRKVMAAVNRLAYRPNAAARTMRMLRTRRLLVTVPDISRPLFSLILQGIEETADREGYSVLLGDTHYDDGREERYAAMLYEKQSDGLIFLGRKMSRGVEAFVRLCGGQVAPVVNVLGFQPALGVPSVQINNAAAGADAMDHLYGLGHRRIGVLTGPPFSYVSSERLRGALERAGNECLQSEVLVTPGDFSLDSGVIGAERLLADPKPPTAIFCFNDEMALGALHTARRRNLRVPDDLSLIGVDDILYSRYASPPLTTVAQPMREMGQQAARVLIAILSQSPTAESLACVPHSIVVRGSTGPPPTDL